MRRRPIPLVIVLAALLVGSALVSSIARPVNPFFEVAGTNAESTALYCAGLTDAKGAAFGHVAFENTSDARRTLALRVSSDAKTSWTGSIVLAAHTRTLLTPSTLVKGQNYGVAAEISGTGVVGEVVTTDRRAELPCVDEGQQSWYATGFDTRVGSSATLNILNPTATPAVFSVSIYSSAGFSAPAPFQGLSVAPHGEVTVNLGDQIVNTTNVGVWVKVLRGALAVTGVEDSNGTTSLVAGSPAPTPTSWFSSVTTVNGATAQVRLANPHNTTTSVTVKVSLAHFAVTPQTVQLAPFSTGIVTITPNPAIAPDAYATLKVSASQGVVADLAVGDGSYQQLSASPAPVRTFTVEDFNGRGFDATRVTNTSDQSATLSVAWVRLAATSSGPLRSATVKTTLAPGATISLSSLFTAAPVWNVGKIVVSTRRPVLVAGLTLPTTPAGSLVVAPLNGR
ncbi:MAG: hypothetical protein KGJ10_03965 [Acidobacteriota bacterium]|nr:hypothetical protein [Acidobacteriota bacterium]